MNHQISITDCSPTPALSSTGDVGQEPNSINAANTTTTGARAEGQYRTFEDDVEAFASLMMDHELTESITRPTSSLSMGSQQPAGNGWLQAAAALTAYDGGQNFNAEITSRLQAIDLGRIDRLSGLFPVLQALVAQANQENVVDIALATRTRRHGAKLVQSCPPDHPRRSEALFVSAAIGRISYSASRDVADLNEAVTYLRALLKTCSNNSERVECLEWLARALFDRFHLQRSMDDLNDACDHLVEALGLRVDDSRRAITLTNLGFACSTRFDMVGRMSDLQKAIDYHRQALLIRQEEHRDHSLSLYLLANDLVKRFEQMKEADDLEAALNYHHEALSLRPDGHPLRHLSLISLGRTMVIHFQHLGREEQAAHSDDIEQAITHHREALSLCPGPQDGHPEHEDRVSCLSTLVFSLRIGFEKLGLGGTDSVLEAADHGSEAERLLPEGHPSLVGIRKDLAFLHLYLQEPDLDRAFHLFRRAVDQETASAKERLSAAVEWAACARLYEHPSTKEAYSKAMAVLHRCLIAYSTVDSQHEFLARPLTRVDYATLASDAASFAIQEGRLADAIEILEQGRTFVWSRMRGYRHPLAQLRAADSSRADDFERLSGEVERFAVTFESTSRTMESVVGFPRVLNARFPLRRDLADHWRTKLEDIRDNVPGFRDFLRPLPFVDLCDAAAGGPVIVVNWSKYGSDALILRGGVDPVVRVPLEEGADALVLRQVAIGSQAYVSEFRAARISIVRRRPRTYETTLGILKDAWKLIVHPVVEQLLAQGIHEMSRIWWCPTGALAALPLHAAGPYFESESNLPDLFISSYTPTLSALITARETLMNSSHDPNLLLVGAPGTAENPYANLPHVEHECKIARSWLPRGNDLIGSAATREAVLTALRSHSWVHFACHALHSRTQPFNSSFVLHKNELLSLRNFMTAHTPNAGLAFLSACDSAAADTSTTPDEVLHLAAAVQFSGFCSVVATLWTMADNDGPSLAQEFYSFLLRHGVGQVNLTDSAEALNRAVKVLIRARVPPERWVSFIHMGV
ncbi:hypothetical protein EW146_g2917 [Bondarzewia mesenterica]|uniref:CHAT domain-containing protein n=1 Tax=Bondarzewia mesenterica TaxID=1095465 RepID=A0A4S4M541_9AGAM|nr:hypothetical protein EW146_g2917 [Bondarzewia mesenterica]